MPESLIDLAGLRVGPEEFLVAVLETTAQPLWVVDQEGVIRFANPAAITALGYERADDLAGHDSHATIHYRHKDGTPFPADECPLLRPLATGDRVTSELDWFVRRDGSMFPVSYVSAPLEMDDGRGAVVAFTDIEDRLRAEEALGKADAELAAQHAALRDELARLANEQAALRRVATLVARGIPPSELLAAVSREVGLLVGGDVTHIGRYEGDGTASLVASWSRTGGRVPIGTVAPADGDNVASLVLRTGHAARMNSYDGVPGPIAAMLRELGVRSSVGAPIVVQGRPWGVVVVSSKADQPLSADSEQRIAAFTELVATAISNTEVQAERARLADEQAALRRVATLVAEGVPAGELFGAVAEEVGRLLRADAAAMIRYERDVMTAVGNWTAEGVDADTEVGRQWPLAGDSLAPRILRTRQSARIDDWRDVPGLVGDYVRTELGLSSSVGSPIIVAGRVWGNLVVHSTSGPLPADTEERLAGFTELVATAIANSEAQEEAARLADEQAALRRVATMVARQREAAEVFAAVAEEVGRLLSVADTAMLRYEDDDSATFVASWGEGADIVAAGTRLRVDGENVAALIRRTERPARIDDYATASGSFGARMRELGIGAAVGCPIVVDGRLWGTMIAAQRRHEPLPPDTESHVAQFTELIATAISNLQARAEVARLAEEQAALRRVATLVAEAVPPSEFWDAVVEAVGTLFGTDVAGMIRYETDGTVTAVATWAAEGEHPPVEGRWSLEGDKLATTISRERRPTREDDWDNVQGPIAEFVRTVLGIRSSVGSPIIVEGRVWGALFVHSKQEAQPLPRDTESRLTNFTELVATAMSNAEAREDLSRLANEQAALRRVATLVARESSPTEVFEAVAQEVAQILGTEGVGMLRFDLEGTATLLAQSDTPWDPVPLGTRFTLEGENVVTAVFRAGEASRLDDWSNATGPVAAMADSLGIRSSVATPIVVEGRLWGTMIAVTRQPGPLPADTESRIGEFTELVATAISNIEARSELAASRARIVAAADEERRQVVRDLHDGAQQRLVHTLITLKLARRALETGADDAPAQVTEAIDQAQQATVELRELAHGILPRVLMHGGLRAGVEALASRMAVPVEIDVSVGRLPTTIEATAYFVIAEALTNVAKHAHAQSAAVGARIEDDTLRVAVRDDGVGGAWTEGSGLVGLRDRLSVLDGRLRVDSPSGGGTLVAADIPLTTG